MSRHPSLSRGFQSGWVKDANGCLGKKWSIVTCGTDCLYGIDCRGCPGLKEAQETGARVQTRPENLLEPLSWTRGHTVFACAEGDLFHRSVPDEFIYQALSVMESRPQDRYILLTKRAPRLLQVMGDPGLPLRVYAAGRKLLASRYLNQGAKWGNNIWVGVSVGSQDQMSRADVLPDLPDNFNKVLFVAPMIGPAVIPEAVLSCLSWVVCGAERASSHCKPRPCKLEWQITLKEQVKAAGLPFYLLRRFHEAWVPLMGGKFCEVPEGLVA
jgi:protein gp37